MGPDTPITAPGFAGKFERRFQRRLHAIGRFHAAPAGSGSCQGDDFGGVAANRRRALRQDFMHKFGALFQPTRTDGIKDPRVSGRGSTGDCLTHAGVLLGIRRSAIDEHAAGDLRKILRLIWSIYHRWAGADGQ